MNGFVTAGASFLALCMLAGLWWVGRLPTIQAILALAFGFGLSQTFVGDWVGVGLTWLSSLAGHLNPGWTAFVGAGVALLMGIRVIHDLFPSHAVHRATVWVAMLWPSVLVAVGGLVGLVHTVTSQIPAGG